MVPRGEVGLIFASVGLATKALPDRVFVAVLVAVFATTFVAPPMLKALRPKARPDARLAPPQLGERRVQERLALRVEPVEERLEDERDPVLAGRG